MNNNIILIAPPAAGKGTMADMLSEKYGYVHISVGQLLRDIDPKTELGKKVRELQKNRELVNNDIVFDSLVERLNKDDVKNNGFILDGFPRTLEQAEILDKLSAKLGFVINKIVYLKVSYEIALKRTLGRYTCSKCKTVYNTNTGFNNPVDDKNCRLCGASLERRNDDNEESLKKGFDKFNNEVLPLINYYKSIKEVIEVSADKSAAATFEELEKKLELL